MGTKTTMPEMMIVRSVRSVNTGVKLTSIQQSIIQRMKMNDSLMACAVVIFMFPIILSKAKLTFFCLV